MFTTLYFSIKIHRRGEKLNTARNNKKYTKILNTLVLTMLLIAICVAIYVTTTNMKNNNTSNGVLWQEEDSLVTHKTSSYISIPGFSEIHFSANNTKQKFLFHNPVNNICIMDVELLLPNDEVLLTEKNIHPGYGIKETELHKILPSGRYDNCKLVIRCHSSDGVFYNGATLAVKLYIE